MDDGDLSRLFDEKLVWCEQTTDTERNDGLISQYMQSECWTVGGLESLLKESHDSNNGWTGEMERNACLPLVIATQSHNLVAVKLLLSYGANAQKKDNKAARKICTYSGLSALDEAGLGCYLDVIKEIFKYEVDKEDCYLPLISAVENDRIDIVRFLCKQGIKLDADYDGEESALFIATERQNMEMIEVLLANGASVEFSKNVPLVEACRICNMDIVKLLIEGGCV